MSELVFEIHDWTLKVDENMLCRPEREVYLEPRLVNLLLFLARNAGTVFGREALINEVWDGAEVTDQVVTQSIFELRKILKDGRPDAIDYIVTVPKRGYKLAALARPLQAVAAVMTDEQPAPAVNPVRSDLNPPAVAAEDQDQSAAASFPARPLTRAITDHAKDPHRRWKMIGFDIFVVVILVTIVSVLGYQRTTPMVNTLLDPNLLVFRFDSCLDGQNQNVRLADGITRALMGEVAASSQLRVQYGASHLMTGIVPGKELNVRVSCQPQGTYLDLEYRNINTNRVLFSHKYQLSGQNVHGVLQASRHDLLQVIDRSAVELGIGWPTDASSLMAMMEAQYYINSQDPEALNHGIELLDKAIAAQPDQPLLLAERYLAGEVRSTLAGRAESERLQGIGSHLARVAHNGGVMPARVWEALTLRAILNGQLQGAADLLALAASRGRSVLYYILQGKLAELNGHPEDAGDAYSQAFLMEATELTYLLCQQLGFYSDMKALNPMLFNSRGQSKVKLF